VALEQAFAFELGVRQRDVIGEWIPVGWPGLSDVVYGPRKWLMGIRWEEIDADLILCHRLSKSKRGKDAMMNPNAGKLKAWDLKNYPMIMDELRCIASKEQFTRADLPASGPLIVCEAVGRPWERVRFARMWRVIAKKAGIPANIQNRDSRPGAATEADVAGAPREKTQRLLGHSRGETTGIYLREELEISRELARMRTKKRQP
jgi:integrase